MGNRNFHHASNPTDKGVYTSCNGYVPPFVVVVGIFTIIGVTITIIKLALGLVDRKRKRVNFEIEEIEVRKQDPFSWDFIRIDVHVRNKSQRAITILDFNVSQKVQSKWEEHHIGDLQS